MNIQFDLARIRAIAEELDTLCGDDDECFADMIEGETDLHRIIGQLHDRLSSDGELIVGIKARQADLSERRARLEARTDAAKAAIGKFLRAARLAKVELPEATYSVRDGKPKLEIVDPDAVPMDLRRVKSEPDKSAINEAFAEADELPNWLVRTPPADVVTRRAK